MSPTRIRIDNLLRLRCPTTARALRLYKFRGDTHVLPLPVTPDDHSEVVPPLPIPNRTVKRLSADDSAGSRVKVGHRQALIEKPHLVASGAFFRLNDFPAVCRLTHTASYW